MSYSFTATETKTFTLTHARHLAAKVAADLKRLQRLYGHITDERIGEFEGEVTELLRQGYLGTVTYGFQRDDKWIEPTLRYTASELANSGTDDDPGRVIAAHPVDGYELHVSHVRRGAPTWRIWPESAQANHDSLGLIPRAGGGNRPLGTRRCDIVHCPFPTGIRAAGASSTPRTAAGRPCGAPARPRPTAHTARTVRPGVRPRPGCA